MDNYFKNCPAMMEDGQFLTDYQTATRRNEYIKYLNGIYRDDQYRLFLQQNANTFMNNEWEWNKTNNRCFVNPCVHQYPTRSSAQQMHMEKLAFESIYNPSKNTEQMKQLKTCPVLSDYRVTY